MLHEKARQLRFFRQRRELAAAYRRAFSTDDGKVVLKDLMRFGHFGEASFRADDPHLTSFREGERNAVLRILNLCGLADIDPEHFIQELEHDHADNAADATGYTPGAPG